MDRWTGDEISLVLKRADGFNEEVRQAIMAGHHDDAVLERVRQLEHPTISEDKWEFLVQRIMEEGAEALEELAEGEEGDG